MTPDVGQILLERQGGASGGGLEEIAPASLADGIGATPIDYYVIWTGGCHEGRAGSVCSRALALVTEVWTPVPLRELVLRAARIEGDAGFRPEAVRGAVRQHQRAREACYLLVRRTQDGDFVTVTDVPIPAAKAKALRTGEIVLSRAGDRFSGSG